MLRFRTLVLLGLLSSVPAYAGDDVSLRPRLVPGGVDIAQGDKRIELMSSKGLSLGTLSPITPAFSGFTTARPANSPALAATGTLFDKLALGGYVAYSLDTYTLSSAVRSREGATTADFSASYVGALMGYPGTAALTVGYDWRRAGSMFSPNTQSSGLDAVDALTSGVSVSLSWNHSVTPSLYFGGFASAQLTSPQALDIMPQPGNTFRLGAGVGLKF